MAKSIRYLKSAVHPQDFPLTSLPEIAVAGRSNAGKSSFINSWANSKVALVSQTPGKTRLLNFFNVENKYLMVDTPGYGFAARSGEEVLNWRPMLENYLLNREGLKGLLLIMDVRRDWSDDEELIKNFCLEQDLGILVVLTKIDKISRNEQLNYLRQKQKASGLETVRLCSSVKKLGVTEIEEEIFESWLKEFVPKDTAQRERWAEKDANVTADLSRSKDARKTKDKRKAKGDFKKTKKENKTSHAKRRSR